MRNNCMQSCRNNLQLNTATAILLKCSFSRQWGFFVLFCISTVACLKSMGLLFKEEEEERDRERLDTPSVIAERNDVHPSSQRQEEELQ